MSKKREGGCLEKRTLLSLSYSMNNIIVNKKKFPPTSSVKPWRTRFFIVYKVYSYLSVLYVNYAYYPYYVYYSYYPYYS